MIQTGLTSGVTALLMLYLKDSNMDAICLLGNAKNNADYIAAAEVVKVICALTKMKVDIDPLLQEAKTLEKALMENIKTIEEKESKYYLQSINTLNGIYDSELYNKYNKTLSLEEALFLQQNLETFYIDCINIKNYDIIIPEKYIDKKICDIKYLYLIDCIELSVKEHSWREQVKKIFKTLVS
jgi:hypothetical protein